MRWAETTRASKGTLDSVRISAASLHRLPVAAGAHHDADYQASGFEFTGFDKAYGGGWGAFGSCPPSAPTMIDITSRTSGSRTDPRSQQQPVLLDIWAPWCGPARRSARKLEKLEAEYAGRFQLAKLNSDEVPEIATQLSQMFGVRSIPFCVMFVDGQPVDGFGARCRRRRSAASWTSICPEGGWRPRPRRKAQKRKNWRQKAA